jgi:hypothetical protein
MNNLKEQNSIKLIRGQRGSFGWEIKLVGEDENDIKKRLDIINEEMVKSYNLNLREDK